MKAVPTQVGYSRLGHSILPISGKPEIGCCPHPSRRAHAPSILRERLRIRAPQDEGRPSSRLAAEPFSVIPSSRCQTAHLVPAARFCARGLQPCFTNPESRGGRSAERRSGARRNTRGVRHNAAYQALARRLASHDAANYWRKQRNDFKANRCQCPNSVPNRDRPNENSLFARARARHDDDGRGAVARAEATGAGRLVPARLHRERFILHGIIRHRQAPNGTCPRGWLPSGSYCLRNGARLTR